MLSSLLPKSRDLTRLTRCGVTTIRVGNIKLPFVQRLAEKDSVEGPDWLDSPACPGFNDALIPTSSPILIDRDQISWKPTAECDWRPMRLTMSSGFQTSDSIPNSQVLQELSYHDTSDVCL